MNKAEPTKTEAFLEKAGWSGASIVPLAGDASARRFQRLTLRGGQTAILMETPQREISSVHKFRTVARHLAKAGLSAPRVLYAEDGSNLLLVEDLGDALFASVVETDPNAETTLYLTAASVLAEISRFEPLPGLTTIHPRELAAASVEPFDWYPNGVVELRPEIEILIEQGLNGLTRPRAAFSFRDFHCENLIWLPKRSGASRAGLIDFQDAVNLPAAYDLASLLRDARRAVSAPVQDEALTFISNEMQWPKADLSHDIATLSVQRNLRILFLFCRLARQDGKTRYLGFLPHLWRTLMEDLKKSGLVELEALVKEALPIPAVEEMQS